MSYCKHTKHTVFDVVTRGLGPDLMPQLAPTAGSEVQDINSICTTTTLNNAKDVRLCPFSKPDGKLRTGALYKLLIAAQGPATPLATFLWRNRAPPRVQFFAWLLVQDRVQCRANLLRKNAVQTARCEVCAAPTETATHILFECPFVVEFWQKLGFSVTGWTTARLHTLPRPSHVPPLHFDTLVLLCCWHLWKRRNGAVSSEQNKRRYDTLLQPARAMQRSGSAASRTTRAACVTLGAICLLRQCKQICVVMCL